MDIASVSAVVAAMGVIVGVVFTSQELRNLTKARKTDTVMRLYTSFSSKEFQETNEEVLNVKFEDYNDFVKKYGSFDPPKPVHTKIALVTQFYEVLGVLVRRNLVDMSVVMDLWNVPFKWERLLPIIEGERKRLKEPRMCVWFEYLYNEWKKRDQTLQAQS